MGEKFLWRSKKFFLGDCDLLVRKGDVRRKEAKTSYGKKGRKRGKKKESNEIKLDRWLPLPTMPTAPPTKYSLKIGLAGTHGVGKTTLAHFLTGKLKEKGMRVEVVTEVARDCPFSLNEQSDFDAQFWILAMQLARELEAGNRAEIIVTDRTVVDNFAYACYAYEHRKMNKHEREEMWRVVKFWLERQPYSFIFIVEPLEDIQDDGFRSTDPQFQKEIREILGSLLKEAKWKFEVIGGTGEERLEKILKILEKEGYLGKLQE